MIPSIADGGTVAFQGNYQREYTVNLNATNKVTVTFNNVVYRENSTLQYKILPSPGNALYLEAEGHQNYSWGVYLTIKDGDDTILSSALIDTRLSSPILAEHNKPYTIEIEITIPRNIQNGRYLTRFMALSKEYEPQNQASNSEDGISAGAKITESIAIEHCIIVGHWPIDKSRSGYNPIFLGIALISILLSIMMVVIRRLKVRKQSTS